MAKTNIFPLYLNADADAVSATDGSYAIVSSRVVIDSSGAAVDLTLDDPAEDGTFVRFEMQTGSNASDVVFTDTSDTTVTVTLNATDDAADLIYFGDQWRVVALYGTAAVA
jgi:hypothetical protein